jgi:flagellar hook-associated protein 3 FlgL
MRISTRSLQLQWLADVYRRQAEMARLQKQVSSGLRITTAADDPAGASQIVALQQGIARLGNYAANGEAVRRRLTLEESALDTLTGSLARVRELTVQAGGGVQTNETRRAIATEMRELLANMVDTANSQDGEGNYLFAGNAVATRPVSITGAVASYGGDDGVRAQRIGDSRVARENDPGSEVFFAIRNGNGTYAVEPAAGNTGTAYFRSATVTDPIAWIPDDYTVTFTSPADWTATDSGGTVVASGTWSAGTAVSFNGASIVFEGEPVAGDSFRVNASAHRDVFGMVARIVTALESDNTSPVARAGFQSTLNATLLDLDQAESHIENVRASVGARLAAVEDQRENNAEVTLQLEKTLSTVRDVDFPKAVSELQTTLTALEAAQRVFAETRSTTLFDLL